MNTHPLFSTLGASRRVIVPPPVPPTPSQRVVAFRVRAGEPVCGPDGRQREMRAAAEAVEPARRRTWVIPPALRFP